MVWKHTWRGSHSGLSVSAAWNSAFLSSVVKHVRNGQAVRFAGVHALKGRFALGKQILRTTPDDRILHRHTQIQKPVHVNNGAGYRAAERSVRILCIRSLLDQPGKRAVVLR